MNKYEEERERILKEVKKRLEELFPHKLHWPTCYKCKTEMCEVMMEDDIFYQCMTCLHREWSI